MKSYFQLFILICIFCNIQLIHAQIYNLEWQKTIGGNYSDSISVIKPTNDGGYIIAGSSLSAISGEKSENSMDWDYWVVKLDSNKNIQWQNTIGGSGVDFLFDIEQTTDGGYICGGNSESFMSGDKTENRIGGYDYWIIKLNSNGNIEWQNTIGGTGYDYLSSIKQTTDGGYLCHGYSASLISGDKTIADQGVWLVKLNSLGSIQWQKVFLAGYNEYINTTDGGFVFGGTKYVNNPLGNNNDYWIIKYDSLGNIQWQDSIGGDNWDNLYSIKATIDGGFICGGISNSGISGDKTEASIGGNDDYWIVKLDSLGVIQWQNTIGTTDYDDFSEVIQLSDGNYLCIGKSSAGINGDKTVPSKGQDDIWIIKLNSNGEVLYDIAIGGQKNDELNYITELENGNFLIGSRSNSNIGWDKSEISRDILWYEGDYWIFELNITNSYGTLFNDLNLSCINNLGEFQVTGNIPVTIQPGNISTFADNGIYFIDTLTPGTYTATVDTTGQWKAVCSNSITFTYVHPDSNLVITPIAMFDTKPGTFKGRFYLDRDSNCVLSPNDNFQYVNFPITIQPGNIVIHSNNNGIWRIDSLPIGNYTATFDTSGQWKTQCSPTFNFSITSNNAIIDHNFAVYDTKPCSVFGYIFKDINNNCIQELSEQYLNGNFTILIQPGNIVTQSNNSYWRVDSLPYGTYTATIDTSQLKFSCPIRTFSVSNTSIYASYIDFGIKNMNPCVEPNISLYNFNPRPCQNNTIYLEAKNLSSSLANIYNAFADVKIDSNLTFVSASRTYTYLGNHTYRFQLDTILINQTKTWTINTLVSCNALIGQTYCNEAKLFPVPSCALDSTANPVSGVTPCLGPWDQSSLSVEAQCIGDSIRFVISNHGVLGNGNMDCFLPFRLYIDNVLMQIDSLKLLGGDSLVLTYLSDGKTWRLEADQHPLHPGNSHPNASVEACGDSIMVAANWTPGLVTTQYLNTSNPAEAEYCAIVVNSYDPNDKTGFPTGTTNFNYILSNQQMEYFIRFQNTGTAPAINVVIRDTLETDLNIFSVVKGVSSHPCTFRMYGPRILEWKFTNIMLPDSFQSEPNSHGFVSFTVEQNENLSNGTMIDNSAAIYFDFNSPIITNISHHEIQKEHFTTTKINDVKSVDIQVYPNPNNGLFTVDLSSLSGNSKITIFNLMGQVIYNSTPLNDQSTEINLSNFAKGIYVLKVENGGKEWNKKVVKN